MLCQCGCGQETNLALCTDTARGIKKGDPLMFVRFHHLRKFQKHGEEHPRWRGDEIGYYPLHTWLGYTKKKNRKMLNVSASR